VAKPPGLVLGELALGGHSFDFVNQPVEALAVAVVGAVDIHVVQVEKERPRVLALRQPAKGRLIQRFSGGGVLPKLAKLASKWSKPWPKPNCGTMNGLAPERGGFVAVLRSTSARVVKLSLNTGTVARA